MNKSNRPRGPTSQPSDISNRVRVISVQRSFTGVATVVIDMVSSDRYGGRPGIRARIEYNFFTEETKPKAIGAQARNRLMEQLAILNLHSS